MKRVAILLLFFTLGPLCGLAHADKLFLKDGRVVEGNILTRNDMQYYVAVEGSSEPTRVNFSDVIRIVLNAQETLKSSLKKALTSSSAKKS